MALQAECFLRIGTGSDQGTNREWNSLIPNSSGNAGDLFEHRDVGSIDLVVQEVYKTIGTLDWADHVFPRCGTGTDGPQPRARRASVVFLWKQGGVKSAATKESMSVQIDSKTPPCEGPQTLVPTKNSVLFEPVEFERR